MEIEDGKANCGTYFALADAWLKQRCLGYRHATCRTRVSEALEEDRHPNQCISAISDSAALLTTDY